MSNRIVCSGGGILLRRRMLKGKITENMNLIDRSKLIYGLLNITNGEIIVRNDWMTTDFIPIDGTDHYEMEGFTMLRYFVVDAEKNCINRLADNSFKAYVLINGAYVRFTFPATDAETITFRHV